MPFVESDNGIVFNKIKTINLSASHQKLHPFCDSLGRD